MTALSAYTINIFWNKTSSIVLEVYPHFKSTCCPPHYLSHFL